MDIAVRTQNDVSLIAFAGDFDTNTSPEAQQALDGIVEGGGHRIVVDFTNVDYISSAGLRVLLATAKRVQGVGGTLHMFGLNETVEEVFEISGFSMILKVFRTEAEALEGV
jgi:anti-anti-sigma factor